MGFLTSALFAQAGEQACGRATMPVWPDRDSVTQCWLQLFDFSAKPKPRNGLDSVSHCSEAVGCPLCLLLKTNRLHEAVLRWSGRDKAICPVLPVSGRVCQGLVLNHPSRCTRVRAEAHLTRSC